MNIWIFSNNRAGHYENSDWDTSTILKHKRYYFKTSEPNRSKVVAGDRAILREYGTGLWGICEVAGDWENDSEAQSKHEIDAGWFPITKIHKWDTTLPYELVKEDLSNQNHRLRIAKATEQDVFVAELALRVYQRLGYGSTDGSFLSWRLALKKQ